MIGRRRYLPLLLITVKVVQVGDGIKGERAPILRKKLISISNGRKLLHLGSGKLFQIFGRYERANKAEGNVEETGGLEEVDLLQSCWELVR